MCERVLEKATRPGRAFPNGRHCPAHRGDTDGFDVTWHGGKGYSLAYWGKDLAGTLYATDDGKAWRLLPRLKRVSYTPVASETPAARSRPSAKRLSFGPVI